MHKISASQTHFKLTAGSQQILATVSCYVLRRNVHRYSVMFRPERLVVHITVQASCHHRAPSRPITLQLSQL